jgi:hypothetical protein
MKNTILFICFIFCLSCRKEPPQKCPFCNVDTSSKTLSFTVSGQFLDKCSGQPLSNKRIEWFVSHGDQSVIKSSSLSQDGKYNISYSEIFAFAQPVNSTTTAPFIIRIPEDSITFVLPATINFSNLVLSIKDTINCKVIVELAPDSRPFTASDTLIYSFEGISNTYFGYESKDTKNYRKTGPFTNQAIENINERTKVIYLDEKGKPFFNCLWVISSANSRVTSSSFVAKTTKQPCELKKDSVVIKLKI